MNDDDSKKLEYKINELQFENGQLRDKIQFELEYEIKKLNNKLDEDYNVIKLKKIQHVLSSREIELNEKNEKIYELNEDISSLKELLQHRDNQIYLLENDEKKNKDLIEENIYLKKQLENNEKKLEKSEKQLKDNEKLVHETLSQKDLDKTSSYKNALLIHNDQESIQIKEKIIRNDDKRPTSFCNEFIKTGKCPYNNCYHEHVTREWIDTNRPKCKYDDCQWGVVCRYSHKKE